MSFHYVLILLLLQKIVKTTIVHSYTSLSLLLPHVQSFLSWSSVYHLQCAGTYKHVYLSACQSRRETKAGCHSKDHITGKGDTFLPESGKFYLS